MKDYLGLKRFIDNIKKSKESLKYAVGDDIKSLAKDFNEVLEEQGVKEDEVEDFLKERRDFFKKLFYVYLGTVVLIFAFATFYIISGSIISFLISCLIGLIFILKLIESSFRCYQIDKRSLKLSLKDFFREGKFIP